ncbi:hypothetical protein ACJX0J_027487, partial [Zea mays]
HNHDLKSEVYMYIIHVTIYTFHLPAQVLGVVVVVGAGSIYVVCMDVITTVILCCNKNILNLLLTSLS